MIESLREDFVPVAVDQHVHRRLQNVEGRLFAKVLEQAGRGLGGRSQGVYIFQPDGELLAFANTSDAGHVKRLMAKARSAFNPAAVPVAEDPPEVFNKTSPPEGTTIVTVTSKVLGGYEKAEGRLAEVHASSLGRDHLWIRADETKALAQGAVPTSLTQRLVRFHLVDNTRGEPPFWRPDEVRQADLTLRDGELSGRVVLRSKDGSREYVAELYGRVNANDDALTRFDLVACGPYEGEGRYTRGAPPGKFPFAAAFRLADPENAADRVVPGAARNNISGYLK